MKKINKKIILLLLLSFILIGCIKTVYNYKIDNIQEKCKEHEGINYFYINFIKAGVKCVDGTVVDAEGSNKRIGLTINK